jgi:hypothetical protein
MANPVPQMAHEHKIGNIQPNLILKPLPIWFSKWGFLFPGVMEESDKKEKSVNAAKGKRRRKGISMTEDSPNWKKMRKQVKDAKVKQAEKANRLRRTKAVKYSRKDPLEVGDICTVSTQGLKKIYVPHLPVFVT